jgi:DNA primase
MSFPPEFLEQLRARVSIAEVIGKRVAFDRRKSDSRRRDFWACCPFHGEKTPSFHVKDAEGYYYCFGCGARGDAISFLEQSENLTFPEAVERLAAEAGMALPPRDAKAAAHQDKRRLLQDTLEAAQRFFVCSFKGKEGEAARRYLEGRGCAPALWEQFGLGFAPSGNALFEHLRRDGLAPALLAEAGLIGQDESRGPYDRFRGRLIFPIRDAQDRLVGFGGRLLAEDPKAPKYLNSPETPLFDKGRLLFNYAAARRALRDAQKLVVVEGYMDVIALSGAGFTAAVAPLGTALTGDQLALLWRLSPEPVLCFDGDSAGQRAAGRAADLALPLVGPGQSLRFALLPEGQDPDDLLRSGGAAAMRAVLAEPQPLIEFLFARERDAAPLDTPENKADLERRLLSAARRIADGSVRGHYEQALRGKLRALFAPIPGQGFTPRPFQGRRGGFARGQGGGPAFTGLTGALRRNPLVQDARRIAARHPAGLGAPSGLPAGPDPAEVSHLLTDIEALLLCLILDHPELLGRVAEDLGHIEPVGGQLDKIFFELIHLAGHEARLDDGALQDHLRGCGIWGAVEGIAARDMVRRMRAQWVGRAVGDVEHAWRALAERHVKVQRLRAEIMDAEAALGEEPGADAHWQRLRALMAERQTLEQGGFWPEDGAGGARSEGKG